MRSARGGNERDEKDRALSDIHFSAACLHHHHHLQHRMAAITLRCCALLLIASLAVLTGAWRTLGPEVRGAQGVAFRVWAPHASRVCITGSFTSQPLAMAPERNGTWYVLVGNAQIGQSYNYLIEYVPMCVRARPMSCARLTAMAAAGTMAPTTRASTRWLATFSYVVRAPWAAMPRPQSPTHSSV